MITHVNPVAMKLPSLRWFLRYDKLFGNNATISKDSCKRHTCSFLARISVSALARFTCSNSALFDAVTPFLQVQFFLVNAGVLKFPF